MKISSWVPRIITIVFILFLCVFSLDVFNANISDAEVFYGLLMHNIYPFIIAVILVFSWKKEKMGGVLLAIAGLVSMFFYNTYQGLDTFLLISFPPILAGLFFIYNNKGR